MMKFKNVSLNKYSDFFYSFENHTNLTVCIVGSYLSFQFTSHTPPLPPSLPPTTHLSSNQFRLPSASFTIHMCQEAKVRDQSLVFTVVCDIIFAVLLLD